MAGTASRNTKSDDETILHLNYIKKNDSYSLKARILKMFSNYTIETFHCFDYNSTVSFKMLYLYFE